MSKLNLLLEGMISAFVVSTHPLSMPYHTHYANTNLSKTNNIAQDWQAIGKDITTASQKVSKSVGMVRYEPKTT